MRRGYLGIAGQQRKLDADIKRFLDVSQDNAIEIVVVERGSPAEDGGLQAGDILIAVNNQPVTRIHDVHRFLSDWPVGQPLNLTIIRALDKINLVVVPIESPYR